VLSPISLNFGTHSVGSTSAAKVITLTNNQKVTLNFTSITVNGADSGDFAQINTCGSLAVGAKCTVSVTFTPSATGHRSATLALTDSAPNSPQTAALNGTGN